MFQKSVLESLDRYRKAMNVPAARIVLMTTPILISGRPSKWTEVDDYDDSLPPALRQTYEALAKRKMNASSGSEYVDEPDCDSSVLSDESDTL